MHEINKYRHIPWNRYNLEKYRDIDFWSYRPALVQSCFVPKWLPFYGQKQLEHSSKYLKRCRICWTVFFCDIYESTFPMQSTEEPRSDRNPIKDITGQIFDLVSKHNSNSTIIKAITDVRVHETLSPKTGKQHAITGRCVYLCWKVVQNLSIEVSSLGRSCWTVCPWSVLLEQFLTVKSSFKSLKPWNVTSALPVGLNFN